MCEEHLPRERLTAARLVERLGEEFGLERATAPDLDGVGVGERGVSRPGLFLAGFADGFRPGRVQLLGEQEMAYLASLDDAGRAEALSRLAAAPVPCIIVSDGREPPSELVRLGNERGVPVLTSNVPSDRIESEFVSELDDLLAPQTVIHGTLVDVYGVGLLFTGKSGIGKSECGLDLVASGHRLVADDAVCVMRTRKNYLIGYGSELLENYMEIRGIGIIDVRAMFGARALRQRKRIEVEVKLASWSELTDYERLGFEESASEILGVEIPAVTLPLVLGKNITVISEVIALNHLLKLRGINAALDFDRSQREAMARRAGVLRATRGDDE